MAVVPSAVGTGPLTVNRAQQSGQSNAIFVVKPTIADFSPKSGLPEATTVIITGTGFLNRPMTVEFSGPVATPITALTATTIGVTVPQGARDGPITVSTAGAGSRATSGARFDVLPRRGSGTRTAFPDEWTPRH